MSGFTQEFEKKLEVWRGIERNITFTVTLDEMSILRRHLPNKMSDADEWLWDWEQHFKDFIPVFNQMSNDDIDNYWLDKLELSFRRLVWATFSEWAEKRYEDNNG